MKKLLLAMALTGFWFNGAQSQSINFDTPSNSVTTGAALDLTNGFTVEYWVKFNSTNNFNGLFSQTEMGIPAPVDIYLDPWGNITSRFGDGNDENSSFGSFYPFQPSRWYHLAHTYDPATTTAKVFVDGVMINMNDEITGLAYLSAPNLMLGNNDEDNRDANINLKDFRIWSGVQTPNPSMCLTGTEPNLEVYYKMDNFFGANLVDVATANGAQTGTFNNIIAWEMMNPLTVYVDAPYNNVGAGGSVVLTTDIQGDAFNVSYEWFKNGISTGVTTPNYTLSPVNDQDSVHVVVTQELPCGTGTPYVSDNGFELNIVSYENLLVFDGTDDYLSVASPVLTTTSNFTIESWLDYNYNGPLNNCVFYNGAYNTDGYGLTINNGVLTLALGGVTTQTVTTLNPNNNHIALVNDANVWIVYVNGVAYNLGTHTAIAPTTGTFVGGSPGTDYLRGSFEELRFWNSVRTQTELLQNSLCANIGVQASLAAYYKFNQGTPYAYNVGITMVADSSGNAINATANNFTMDEYESNFGYSFLNYDVYTYATITSNVSGLTPGGNVTFTCVPENGGANPIFQWYVNSTPVGTNSNTFTTNSLADFDSVYCIVTSSLPCAIGSEPSNVLQLYTIPVGGVPYDNSCVQIGNLEFCDFFYEDDGNFYNDVTGLYGTVIDDAEIISTGQGDAYDGAYELAVNDTSFTDVNYTIHDTLTHSFFSQGQELIPGIVAKKHYRVYENQPILRFVAELKNNNSFAKTINVEMYTNFGSDGNTRLDTSFTGGTTLVDTDRWMVTDDNGSSDPIMTSVRFGPGTVTSQPVFFLKPENGNDDYGDSISVTIPANSTRYVVWFSRLDSTNAAARANLPFFDNVQTMIDSLMFDGIDTLVNVVNWNLAQPTADFTSLSAANGCATEVSFTNTSANAVSYTWDFGDGSPIVNTVSPSHVYTTGTYTVTLTAVNSINLTDVTTSVIVVAPAFNTGTTVSNETITANATSVSYQWINCDNANVAINGETNQSFTATANGNYAVVLSNGTCTDTSACVTIASVGINTLLDPTVVSVYPNPAKDQFNVAINTNLIKATIELVDMMGRVIYTKAVNSTIETLPVNEVNPGIYFVRIKSENRVVYQSKLIKQ